MEWKAEHQQIVAKHKICLCFQNNECIDYISCVYLCSSQPFSILLMHTAVFCLQQQTNAVTAALNPSYFLIQEIPLCTVLRKLLFFFFFSTGKFTYMHMDSYMTSYSNAQLPLPQFGHLMTKTYLFSSPSRPHCVSDKGLVTVGLQHLQRKNSLLVWLSEKSPCVYGQLGRQAERTHRFLGVDIDIPQSFAVATPKFTNSLEWKLCCAIRFLFYDKQVQKTVWFLNEKMVGTSFLNWKWK